MPEPELTPVDQRALSAAIVELSSLPGPPGHETAVIEAVVQRWTPLAHEITVDPIGNVDARIGGAGPRVALVAHLDEIAWVVSYIRPDGLLLAHAAQKGRGTGGRRLANIPLGHPALVSTRGRSWVAGTFATTTGHLLPPDESSASMTWWVDLGLGSRAAVLDSGVHAGSHVVMDVTTRMTGARITGKAMDDRALVAVADAVARAVDIARLPVELHLVATVQEEGGTHGAAAMARRPFDHVIALDVAPGGDLPAQPEGWYPVALLSGPVLVHRDSGTAYSRGLSRRIHAAAAAIDCPLQDAAFPFFGTDGREFVRAGTDTAMLGLPTRYTHSAYETVDLGDAARLVALLAHLLHGGLNS